MKKLWILLALGLPVLITTLTGVTNAFAQSFDGSLTIYPLKKACTTDEPVEAYSVKGGVNGILYVKECSSNRIPNPLVETGNYRFIDTGGSKFERCYGLMTISTGAGGIESVWRVKGAVYGYSCSTIGRTYTVNFPKGY